jgi:septum formation protein
VAAGRVILASASPRRRELLRLVHPDFDVMPSGADETLAGPPGPEAATDLALRKARAVAAQAGAGIVLAADTLVVVQGASLGKPSDRDEARAMLRRLSGRAHQVITGVAVIDAATGRERSDAAVSHVYMLPLGAAEIDAYVASGEPDDKAGAYAIQGQGGRLVAALLGSYTNVVGFPVPTVRRLLAAAGARPPASAGPAGVPLGASPPAASARLGAPPRVAGAPLSAPPRAPASGAPGTGCRRPAGA